MSSIGADMRIGELARRSGVASTALRYYEKAGFSIELIRGTGSDSALDSLLDRAFIARNAHQLFVTTRGFLDVMGLRDLADLPALSDQEGTDNFVDTDQGWRESSAGR